MRARKVGGGGGARQDSKVRYREGGAARRKGERELEMEQSSGRLSMEKVRK